MYLTCLIVCLIYLFIFLAQLPHTGQPEAFPLGNSDVTPVDSDSVFVSWHDKISSLMLELCLITDWFEQLQISALISFSTYEQCIDFFFLDGGETPYQLEIQSFNNKSA